MKICFSDFSMAPGPNVSWSPNDLRSEAAVQADPRKLGPFGWAHVEVYSSSSNRIPAPRRIPATWALWGPNSPRSQGFVLGVVR